MNELLADLKNSIIDMEPDKASDLTNRAVEEDYDPEIIMNQACISAMTAVGEEYDSGDRFVPGMLMSAEAMKESMDIIRPLLAESGVEPEGRIVIGTVEGDLHDIGQNLVAMMLEGAGFEVTNLGTETTADEFVDACKDTDPDLVGLSALLTTTRERMPEVIEALNDEGLRDQLQIIVGGAPVTGNYAEEIGADGYASDATSATRLATELVDETAQQSKRSKPLVVD